MASARSVLSALADESRLRLYGRICSAPEGVPAGELPDGDRRAAKLIGRLITAELVTCADGRYYASPAVFLAVMEAQSGRPSGITAAADVETLFSRGRLVSMPRAGKLRTKLLAGIAERFSRGQAYRESAVGDILREYYDDTAALRRYLVDEGFLDRDNLGSYWRPEASPEDTAIAVQA